MTNGNIQLYGAIEKFDAADDGSLMVSGIASTEAIDAAGEVVTADCMRKAIPAYLQSGSVREMHQPIAAGRPISAHVDDDGKTHFTAHVVDSGTVAKVKAGVLKGFSIGGKAIKKAGNIIHEMLLKEVSLVDLPCNSECQFSVIKFDKTTESDEDKKLQTEKFMTEEAIKKLDSLAATVDALAKTVETLSKITPPVIPDVAKLESAITDLQKRQTESQAEILATQRTSIINKMDLEGRVAFNPDTNVAFTVEELQKMDLTILKFVARNSAAIPLVAKGIYKGDSKPKLDPNLKGSDRIAKVWEKYDDVDKLLSTPFGQSIN